MVDGFGVHCEQPEMVRETVRSLRELHNSSFGPRHSKEQGRVVRAFSEFAALWERRLTTGWLPPTDSAFPWAQVRLSLAALLPGFANAAQWLERTGEASSTWSGSVAALILAGNTPLLSWSPLAAVLLAEKAVFVKQSRDETVWTRLFVDSLAEVDPQLAALIHIDLWPGQDPRTEALVQVADSVIVFGGDATLAALRDITPASTPFFGFGHAVSIGIVTAEGTQDVGKFARDVLLYDQGGCLSAQAILVEGETVSEDTIRNLVEGLERECVCLNILPVGDPAIARTVRQTRDMALFLGGVSVIGDPDLRWTILAYTSPAPLEFPTGYGVIQVVPVERIDSEIGEALGAMQGYISSIGVSGTLTEPRSRALLAEGVSRLCPSGEMQLPPLDWPNGNIDLLAELRKP
jgi:hypothetical protein